MIHDIEPKHLYNEWKPNAVPKRSSAVVQFCGRNLLCRIDDNGLKLPSRAMFPDGDERFTYLFELDGREYYLLRDETPREPDGWHLPRHQYFPHRAAEGDCLRRGQRVAPVLLVPRHEVLRPLRHAARARC